MYNTLVTGDWHYFKWCCMEIAAESHILPHRICELKLQEEPSTH